MLGTTPLTADVFWNQEGGENTPGVTVQSGKLPLRPILLICEIGLQGGLEARTHTQIQIRNRIAADLCMV